MPISSLVTGIFVMLIALPVALWALLLLILWILFRHYHNWAPMPPEYEQVTSLDLHDAMERGMNA